jgi:hypothetical protein
MPHFCGRDDAINATLRDVFLGINLSLELNTDPQMQVSTL